LFFKIVPPGTIFRNKIFAGTCLKNKIFCRDQKLQNGSSHHVPRIQVITKMGSGTIFRNKKFCRDLFKKQNILQGPKTTKWVQSSCATYTSHHKNGVRDYFKKQNFAGTKNKIFFYRDQNLNEPYLQGRVQYLSLILKFRNSNKKIQLFDFKTLINK